MSEDWKIRDTKIMSWNYRIMKKKLGGDGKDYFGLYEVYYDKFGGMMWTKRSMTLGDYESSEELIQALTIMLKDAERSKNDILNYDDKPTYHSEGLYPSD
jgi:hypothetical protein